MDPVVTDSNQGAAQAAPSPLWVRALDVSDFGPCYQPIDVGTHFHAVHVVIATRDHDSAPLEPLPAGQERVDLIIRACRSHAAMLAALKGVLRVADRATDEFDAVRDAIKLAELPT